MEAEVTYWVMLVLIFVQGWIIGCLWALLRRAKKEQAAAVKWAVHREIMRKWHEENDR